MLMGAIDRLISRGLLDASTLKLQLTGPVDDDSPMYACPEFHRLTKAGVVDLHAGLVSRESALRIAGEADYLLVLDLNRAGNAFNGGLQVPAKLYDYLRIGRPILAFTAVNSSVTHILANSGVPHRIVNVGSSESVTDNIVSDFLSLSSKPCQPDAWFTSNFNAMALTQKLHDVFGEVLNGARSQPAPDREGQLSTMRDRDNISVAP
jgi:hypothetical protein